MFIEYFLMFIEYFHDTLIFKALLLKATTSAHITCPTDRQEETPYSFKYVIGLRHQLKTTQSKVFFWQCFNSCFQISLESQLASRLASDLLACVTDLINFTANFSPIFHSMLALKQKVVLPSKTYHYAYNC